MSQTISDLLKSEQLKPRPHSYLQECVVKAIILLETTPVGERFDAKTIKFFNDLYLWRRPEKFFLNDKEAKIISGTTDYYQPGNQKTLKFIFDNGYVWLASITKLNRSNIKICREIARQQLDEEFIRNVA